MRYVTKTILAGFDPRSRDRTPVRFGAAAARLTGAPLVVASVQGRPPVPRPGTSPRYGEIDHDLVADCSDALGQIEARLEARGVAVECRQLVSTSASRGLHLAAEVADAGLLVVGSTRRGPRGRVLSGSTAQRLLAGAPCPLAVVPHAWRERDRLETIGVAYVDSPEAHEALRGAHTLARRLGATLRVITVVQVSLEMLDETEAVKPPHRGKDLVRVQGEHRVRAEQEARRAAEELADDVPVDVDAFVGDPTDVLVELSEHLDLLVLGSRAYGPLRAVLLGSVSRRVVDAARCPVIVLPRGVQASLETLLPRAGGVAVRS
jgi:nucleotide-binding universal stress UspA family protein